MFSYERTIELGSKLLRKSSKLVTSLPKHQKLLKPCSVTPNCAYAASSGGSSHLSQACLGHSITAGPHAVVPSAYRAHICVQYCVLTDQKASSQVHVTRIHSSNRHAHTVMLYSRETAKTQQSKLFMLSSLTVCRCSYRQDTQRENALVPSAPPVRSPPARAPPVPPPPPPPPPPEQVALACSHIVQRIWFVLQANLVWENYIHGANVEPNSLV